MNVGSLFSGIGGIELGFKRAGIKTKWFIEKDEYCQKILRKNFPKVPIYEDIEKINFSELEKVEILTGGFPCQDISYAGKGEGIEGKRSGLWQYYYQAIGILRPEYIFIENVPALLKRGLNVVLADLATCGYNAEWDCIPAVAVGAPHRRDRIFIFAYTNSDRCKRENISKKQKRADMFVPPRSSKTFSNTKSTGKMPEKQQGQGNVVIKNGRNVSDPVGNGCREMSKRQSNTGCTKGTKKIVQGKVSDSDCEGLENGVFGSGAQRTLTRYNSIEGRKQWEVEPELGRVAHGVSNRVDRLRCLGNAVVPQIAELIARRLLEFDMRR